MSFFSGLGPNHVTGEWKNRAIQTYGYADTGMRHFFELEVFDGGDNWNSKSISHRPSTSHESWSSRFSEA